MRRRTTMLATLVTVVTMAALVGCGVPKAEHDKVVSELNKAKQENAALSDQLAKGKDQVAQLQGQVASLTKENEELKAKLAPKKPAAKPAATKPAAKTTTTTKKK